MRKVLSLLIATLLLFSISCAEETIGFPDDPIGDLVALWNEQKIWITLPRRSPAVKNEIKERHLYYIGDRTDYCIILDQYADQSMMYFVLNTPNNYTPARDMSIIALAYFLRMSVEDATDLYDGMVYNLIDGAFEMKDEAVDISLLKTLTRGDMLTITLYPTK